MTAKRTSRKPASKQAWAAANDRGPHLATLPTKNVVRFMIPDSGTLARSGRLPTQLRETALLVAAHPEGADGYFEDLVRTSLIRGEGQETISRLIERGMDLTHFLVAEMLIEPEVTPEEVAKGMFHELDIRMLLEFAERRRSTDAEGRRLPIITLDDWARFRDQQVGSRSAGALGTNGQDFGGSLSDADEAPL